MGLDEEINSKLFEMKKKIAEANKDVEALIPQVLDHFNNYLEHVINPALPAGYSINKATDACYYHDRGFVITTGCYNTPFGPTCEPIECEGIVLDLIWEYQENHKWAWIETGFEFSK
jgi:hypothetical protein